MSHVRRACLIFVLTLGAACSTFQDAVDRRRARSASTEPAPAEEADPSPGNAALDAAEGNASLDDRTEKRRFLRRLEERLQSPRERDQYAKVLPWLENEDERIDLLSRNGLEARDKWIQARGVWRRAQSMDPATKQLVEAGDIAVGMAMDHVRKSWGEPQAVDVSGNPIFHNERWRYSKYVSSSDGYRQEKRWVYFEGGRVVGWETH